MKSLWQNEEGNKYRDDPLQMRVYTSRLLGQDPNLVLHGGGNTSVKTTAIDLLGTREDIIYVKGSGWDLATIERAGFAPVRLDVLTRMAELEELGDADMVRLQRAAMTDPGAPSPSVEAILHAIIPGKFVDHTHADAVVTITNTEHGDRRIKDIYGDRVLIVPYVMPGFALARTVYTMTRRTDWTQLEGMVLVNHGVFTFADDARTSYERMIKIVSHAEEYLAEQGAGLDPAGDTVKQDPLKLARIRREVSQARGAATLAKPDAGPESVAFSNLPNVAAIATRGPLTPDHVLRTKRIPMIIDKNPDEDVSRYTKAYRQYFERHTDGTMTSLDPAPRWAVWPGHGTVAFGGGMRDIDVVSDIVSHTVPAIQIGEALGGWKALGEKEIFEVEYWELEQAKLAKPVKESAPPPLAGKVAFVTGAASGIGKSCVETLRAQGAVVTGVDINDRTTHLFDEPGIIGMVCDVTDLEAIQRCVAATVRSFGGVDILISNAGVFPKSATIANVDPDSWNRSLEINVSSHRLVLQACIPYLELGVDPAVVIIGSKNVAAPGRGASAYSVAKAALAQLARVAALELAPSRIRVNVIHPNNVFDTAIWTPEVLEERAKHHGMSVDEYKTNNLLGVDVTSKDVAALAAAMVGAAFAKTTGAQVPVDGGNDRVI